MQLIVTYHPAYLLRDPRQKKRPGPTCRSPCANSASNRQAGDEQSSISISHYRDMGHVALYSSHLAVSPMISVMGQFEGYGLQVKGTGFSPYMNLAT